MINTLMSNKFAVLGEMKEAQSQKEMLLTQYKLISSLLENCLQLEEDVAVKGVLQKKLLQNGELPSMPKENEPSDDDPEPFSAAGYYRLGRSFFLRVWSSCETSVPQWLRVSRPRLPGFRYV